MGSYISQQEQTNVENIELKTQNDVIVRNFVLITSKVFTPPTLWASGTRRRFDHTRLSLQTTCFKHTNTNQPLKMEKAVFCFEPFESFLLRHIRTRNV